MPCTFVKHQEVKSIITGKRHRITGIRKEPPNEIVGAWGIAIVQDVFINVDNQRDCHGQALWYGYGYFRAL